jgi:hypothetical protein
MTVLVQWVKKMRNSLGLELIIRPKGRSSADEYQHRGQTWIEGRGNSDYVIQLLNHTSGRMCVVVSVDGLSVTDGKLASYDSDGFVVDAYGQVSVPGWLLNSESSAKFVFGTKNSSYASQSGSDVSNVGVIGAAWFDEEAPVQHYTQPLPFFGATAKGMVGALGNNSTLRASAASTQGSMGTGFGDETAFRTSQVSFKKRSSQPLLVQSIFYDSAEELQRMGIRLRERNTYSTRHWLLQASPKMGSKGEVMS